MSQMLKGGNMRRYISLIVFLLCSIHIYAQSETEIEQKDAGFQYVKSYSDSLIEKRRMEAQYVLSYFDSIKVDKILYSPSWYSRVSGSYFFVILDTEDKDEYFIRKSGDTLTVMKTGLSYYQGKSQKHMQKLYEEAQPIFDPERYMHGTIKWVPSKPLGCRVKYQYNYFQYVTARNVIILEYNLFDVGDGCQLLNPDLFAYLFIRLFDEKTEYEDSLKEKEEKE